MKLQFNENDLKLLCFAQKLHTHIGFELLFIFLCDIFQHLQLFSGQTLEPGYCLIFALLHSFNLTILRLCLPVLHCVKVSKPIVGLLNAHNCMGSCMLVKLLRPMLIHHCRVHNWVQAQVVSFASKCFQAWLHYFYYVRLRENFSAARTQCEDAGAYNIYHTHYSLTARYVQCIKYIVFIYIIYAVLLPYIYGNIFSLHNARMPEQANSCLQLHSSFKLTFAIQ